MFHVVRSFYSFDPKLFSHAQPYLTQHPVVGSYDIFMVASSKALSGVPCVLICTSVEVECMVFSSKDALCRLPHCLATCEAIALLSESILDVGVLLVLGRRCVSHFIFKALRTISRCH